MITLPTLEPLHVRAGEGEMLRVMGDEMHVKLSGARTNGLLTLIELASSRGHGVPMHTHDNEDEIFYVLAGEVEVVIDGRKMVAKAGDTVFAPRDVPHAWQTLSQRALMLLMVTPAGIEHMFAELAALPMETKPQRVVEVCQEHAIRFVD